MTSIHHLYDITPTTFDIVSTVSLSSHPDYWSYNPHFLYDNTATICIISYEVHITSHPLFMISQHAMRSHILHSCHHTQYTWHGIHCSCTIIYTVLLYHTYYMCDINPTICMISHEFYMLSHSPFMTSQYCIHDFTSTFFMTAHPLHMTSHTLYLQYHSHCIYDKTPPVVMTS